MSARTPPPSLDVSLGRAQADTGAAATWLNDGIAPNGARGRAFSKTSVHGFDLVFAAPKSGLYLVRTFGFPATPNSTIALAGENIVGMRPEARVKDSGLKDRIRTWKIGGKCRQ